MGESFISLTTLRMLKSYTDCGCESVTPDSSSTYVPWYVEKLQNNNIYFWFVSSFYCTSGLKIGALIFLSLTLQKK